MERLVKVKSKEAARACWERWSKRIIFQVMAENAALDKYFKRCAKTIVRSKQEDARIRFLPFGTLFLIPFFIPILIRGRIKNDLCTVLW